MTSAELERVRPDYLDRSIWRIEEVAHYSGTSVGFIRDAIRQGCGPALLRLGRSIRFQKRAVDAWLESHRFDGGSSAD